MQNQSLQIGSTSPTVKLFFYNTADGTPATVLFNAAGLSLSYARDNAANTALTLVTATLGTWVSSGFISRGGGIHDLYLPTAAAASSAKSLTIVPVGLPTGVSMIACIVPMFVDDVFAAAPTDSTIATASATAVRTNLATELSRLDAPVSGAVSTATLTSQVTALRQALSVGSKFGGATAGGTSSVISVYDAGNSAVLLGTVIVYRDATGAVTGQSALTPP